MRWFVVTVLATLLAGGTSFAAGFSEASSGYRKAKIVVEATKALNGSLDLVFVTKAKELEKAEKLSVDLKKSIKTFRNNVAEKNDCSASKSSLKDLSKDLKQLLNLPRSKKPRKSSSWGKMYYDALGKVVDAEEVIEDTLDSLECDEDDDDDSA